MTAKNRPIANRSQNRMPIPTLHALQQKDQTKVYIGIDPGTKGALAYLLPVEYGGKSKPPHTKVALYVNTLPELDTDEGRKAFLSTLEAIQEYSSYPCIAFVEKVGGFIGKQKSEGNESIGLGKDDKANRASAHTMFSFGANYGSIQMALSAIGNIDIVDVPPKNWQKALSVQRQHRETKTAHKRRMHELAASMYPRNRILVSMADAVLIAHYGMMVDQS